MSDTVNEAIPEKSKDYTNYFAKLSDEEVASYYREALSSANSFKAELHKRGFTISDYSQPKSFGGPYFFVRSVIQKTVTEVLKL